MKRKDLFNRLLIILLAELSINIAVTKPVSAQPLNTANTVFTDPKTDTINTLSPVKRSIAQVVKEIVGQKKSVTLSFNKRKISHQIEKDAPLYPLPGGESRAVVFELPAYVDGYSITISSSVYDKIINFKTFSPTLVFLDSLFRPTHILSEKQFFIKNAAKFTGLPLRVLNFEIDMLPLRILNFETEVVMKSEWKMDKYLLMYTIDSNERLATYNDPGITRLINHPVTRSAYGKLKLKLHLK